MSCKVLIPINDQEAALYSLESVMARKWPDGAQFMLMTVVEDLAATVPASRAVHKEVLAAEQAEYMEFMKGWIERLRDSLSIVFPDTSTEVNSGEICEKILETAAHWGADYIILGSHEFALSSRLALGSIASRILANAPCTVEAVRFRQLPALVSEGVPITPEKIRELACEPPRRVLVATDLSAHSAAAVDWVSGGSWRKGTEIRLVTVSLSNRRESAAVELHSENKSFLGEEKYHRLIEDDLRVLGKRIRDAHPHCKVDAYVLQAQVVSDTVAEISRDWQADLVVVGAQGAGRTVSSRIGSNAISIMDKLQCSVIAVKKTENEPVYFSWY
ncbi:MAG TPA: universal stress protein [Candidatus Obscuribacter sp.]|nr:universal stress protein [Candidatus Obscuribacter sp.]